MNEYKVAAYEKEELHRNLKSRHIEMIAIGGAIGTGLFYGSSWAIKTAGPAITLVYLLAAVAIYCIVRCLGEMAVEEPVSGSFVSYANRYLHRFVAFLCGWNSFVSILAVSAAELNALGRYIEFWFPSVPIWLTAVCAVAIVFAVNIFSVKFFGETEFWFAFIKVMAIVFLIAFGFMMILFGLGHGGTPIGFANLTDFGGFAPNGFSGAFLAIVIVAFSFGGIEDLGMAAGEVKNIKHTMKSAVNATFWRLLIFYVGAIFVLVTIFPWTDLTGKGSPFVEVFSMIGIPGAASIMNLVVITAVLSAVNSSVFFHSRKLYNMALQHNAPAFLGKVNKGGVPGNAIKTVFIIMFLGTVVNYVMPNDVFKIFSSVTVCGLLCNWGCIVCSHLKFRKHRMRLVIADKITYKSPLYPYADYVALLFIGAVITGIAIMPETRVSLLISAIWVCIVYGCYKVMLQREKAKLNQPIAVKETVDVGH